MAELETKIGQLEDFKTSSYNHRTYNGKFIQVVYNTSFERAVIYQSLNLRDKYPNLLFSLTYIKAPTNNCQLCCIGSLDSLISRLSRESFLAQHLNGMSVETGVKLARTILYEIKDVMSRVYGYDFKQVLIDINKQYVETIKKIFPAECIKIENHYISTNQTHMCLIMLDLQTWRINTQIDFTKSGVNMDDL